MKSFLLSFSKSGSETHYQSINPEIYLFQIKDVEDGLKYFCWIGGKCWECSLLTVLNLRFDHGFNKT